MTKKEALAKYFYEDVNRVIKTGRDTFQCVGKEYLVFTQDEAYEYASDDIKQLFDDIGIEAFSESFQDWILNFAIDREWFDDWYEEDLTFYVDDIEDEDDDEFPNRLIRELYEEGIINDSDFESKGGKPNFKNFTKYEKIDDFKFDYVWKRFDKCDDKVEEFIWAFGKNEFKDVVNNRSLIDLDKVVEECTSVDGVSHFIATYDGEEIELENGYYAYRIY